MTKTRWNFSKERNAETIRVIADCRNDQCGRVSMLTVELEKFERWMKGENVKDVFPKLSANEREVIIQSRGGYYLCESCWDLLMVEEDEC